MKKFLSLLLALCLIVGLLPVMAMAEETEEVTATLQITTGTNEEYTQWKPTLSEGMAPAYAKNTAEGALVLEGATEADYNLKVEWPVGGVPTLTMNGATINNDTHHMKDSDPNVIHTVRPGGTADFVILLKGTNTINGNHAQMAAGYTDVANHRMAAGIYAVNTGTLTIKGVNKTTDTLTIDNNGGNGILKEYNALTIDSANVTINMETTARNGQNGIVMVTGGTAYDDKTDLTVVNSTLKIWGTGKYSGNNFIIMGKDGASYSSANTGDILFQNSKITMVRNSGSSVNSAGAEGIRYSANGSLTIDRCDFFIEGAHRTFTYAPTVINCTDVQCKTGWSDWTEYTVTPGTALTSNTNNSGLRGNHVCLAGEPVVEQAAGECTESADTVTYCVICNEELSRVSNALEPTKNHTPGAKVELVDQRVPVTDTSTWGKLGLESFVNSAGNTRYRPRTGKYVFQYTCAVCGETWTEEETFKPAMLYYATSGNGSNNYNTGAGANNSSSYKPTVAIGPGTTKYYTTGQYDTNYPNNWYLKSLTDTAAIEAGNWNVKFEYPLYGNPILTLKNAKIINNTGLWYGYAGYNDLAPVTIVLEGENYIQQNYSAQGAGPFMLQTNNTVTITGDGSLYLESWSTGRALSTLAGDLILDDADITLVRANTNATSTREHAIGSKSGGDVVVNGGSLTYVGFGITSYKADGSVNYSRTGYNSLIKGANVTIQDAKITAHGTFASKADGIIHATGDLTVSESTIFLAHGFAYETNSAMYAEAFKCGGTLTFNYANGVTGKYSTGYTYVDKHMDYTTVTYPTNPADITSVDDLMAAATDADNYVKYMDIAPTKTLEKFEGTTVTVQDDLTLEFAIKAENIPVGSIAYITRGETTTEIVLTEDHKENSPYYVIPCTGISAKEMHDEITVVIKSADGTTVLSETKTDSVYAYILRKLNAKQGDMSDAKYAALKTVLVDMLNYGTMAQVQFDHNTDNLANTVLTPNDWTYASGELAATPAVSAKVEGADASQHLGTTFELNTNIAMLIAVKGAATTAKVYVDGEYVETVTATAYEGFVTFTFNSLNAADGRKDVKFEVYTGETLTLTVTDSLAGYVGRNIDKYPYLADLMKYCDAAAAYFTAV